MSDDDIFRKNEAGLSEMRERSGALPQRLRSILILVDGTRSVGELRRAAATLGAPLDAVEALSARGLIVQSGVASPAARSPAAASAAAPVAKARLEPGPSNGPERFRAAKKFMNDTVVDALGIRAFIFTLKLEKCSVLSDLEELRAEYRRAIEKAQGEEIAGALETRLRELLR